MRGLESAKSLVMRRRTFLSTGLAAAAAGVAISCRHDVPGRNWRFFTNDEAGTVDAVCAQIIPADRDAGAREARVVAYIDIQLTKHFRKYQRTYRQGIAGVDSDSLQRFGKRFVDLPPGQQTEVLKGIEQNAAAFFALILDHTRQGFYGDPRHGGNYQMASWKMLKIPFPPVRGRQHYDG